MNRVKRKLDDTRKVTVCAACLRACCWQGVFFCDRARTAGTVDYPVRTLRKLAREAPIYWLSAETAKPVQDKPQRGPAEDHASGFRNLYVGNEHVDQQATGAHDVDDRGIHDPQACRASGRSAKGGR